MECQSCGNTVSADAKFCSQCGDKIPELVKNLTEAVGQPSPLEEQAIQQLGLAVAMLRDFPEVKLAAVKAYTAIQNASKAIAEVRRSGDGLLAWLGSGKTGRIMTQLVSELGAAYRDLHSLSLATNNHEAEAQAKTLANLVSVAIDAASTVRSYYDAPYASLSVQQAYGVLDAVGRELWSFLK
jgi:hypothetical protein